MHVRRHHLHDTPIPTHPPTHPTPPHTPPGPAPARAPRRISAYRVPDGLPAGYHQNVSVLDSWCLPLGATTLQPGQQPRCFTNVLQYHTYSVRWARER